MNTFLDNIDAADGAGSGRIYTLTAYTPGDGGGGAGPGYFHDSRMIMFGVYMNISM